MVARRYIRGEMLYTPGRPPAMLLLLIMKVMTSTAGVAGWLAGPCDVTARNEGDRPADVLELLLADDQASNERTTV